MIVHTIFGKDATNEKYHLKRGRARSEQTTLNEQFRRWLADYVRQEQQTDSAMALIEELRGQVRTSGRKFTRDEMNER